MTIRKKTKIVATMGPSTQSESVMTRMIREGVNVVRLNFSHGNYVIHKENIECVRSASKKAKTPVAILQDLGGPKIRTGDFEDGSVSIKRGQNFIFTTKKVVGSSRKCFINYPYLPQEVKKGDLIMLDDGRKEFRVLKTNSHEIHCRVITGGELRSRRGVNIPGRALKHLPTITQKDKKDLLFAVREKVDYVALSFVRSAKDIHELRSILRRKRCEARIVAKVETLQALEHIDEIIDSADAIMIARGDLAVEVLAEEVPLIQKEIVAKCRQVGKPVIIATQLLLSMVSSPQPTRAEISDVANSILDGADAIMLSDETTIGEHPVSAIRMMTRVARKTEAIFPYREQKYEVERQQVVDSVSYAAIKVAREVGAKAIIALTESGETARMISRFHPQQPIIVMTPNSETFSTTLLSYGCFPVQIRPFHRIPDVLKKTQKYVLDEKLARPGDKIVIAAGIPFGKIGGTNMTLVQTV